MKAFGAALDLKNDPAVIEEYKEWHRKVWPEVKEALGEVGITAMRIFVIGNHVFMYMEAKDDFEPGRDLQEYRRFPRAMEWDELMRPLQQKVPEAGPDDWWAPMELAFDLDWVK